MTPILLFSPPSGGREAGADRLRHIVTVPTESVAELHEENEVRAARPEEPGAQAERRARSATVGGAQFLLEEVDGGIDALRPAEKGHRGRRFGRWRFATSTATTTAPNPTFPTNAPCRRSSLLSTVVARTCPRAAVHGPVGR